MHKDDRGQVSASKDVHILFPQCRLENVNGFKIRLKPGNDDIVDDASPASRKRNLENTFEIDSIEGDRNR
jgi:hypothetical protein